MPRDVFLGHGVGWRDDLREDRQPPPPALLPRCHRINPGGDRGVRLQWVPGRPRDSPGARATPARGIPGPCPGGVAMRPFLVSIGLVILMGTPSPAQTDYKRPPGEVIRILDAP